MKIEKIIIKNFKGIKAKEIDLNGKSTVFFGENGAGKSSILRSINLLFSNIINKIVSNRFKQGIYLEMEDIRSGASACEISINMTIDNESFAYSRYMNRANKHRTHSLESLDKINAYFKEKYIDDSSDMPIFVNYGVNRVVIDVPLRVKAKHKFDKLSAFEKAIENKIDFRTFFEWFRNQEDLENEMRLSGNLNYKDPQLECVRKAIISTIGDFSNIRIERNPLRMTVVKGNKKLRVEQLSDGEKCTLALVGDLARRIALANPGLKNPLFGRGVVLIDEIELHMHPRWQRRIINVLKEVFPNIQFVITTHSPQVLGELGEDMNILSIESSDDDVSINNIPSLIAWDSNYILEEFMGAKSINSEIKNFITDMYHNIENKHYDEAEKMVYKLQSLTDAAHEDVIKAKILINRGKK